MTGLALDIQGLDVAIAGTPILRNVSLKLPQGSMAGLIGRNGAGKTTLMRAVMGLLPSRAPASRSRAWRRTPAPAAASAICPRNDA